VIVSWLAFPLVLLGLTAGCGLLAEHVGRARLPGTLIPPLGLAVLIVIGGFLTRWDATAELTTPVVVIAAIAGFVLARKRITRLDRWAIAAGVGTFLAYAAPVLLSGKPTFAGYIKLDDTATWLALMDRALEHGRSIEGLAPSTYEAVLANYLATGYPLGSLLPWGIARPLVGTDLAWVFQPYLAFLGAMLGLVAYTLAGAAVRSRAMAAGVAFVASQAALLYAYSLWGGVKEVAAAVVVALVAALVPPAARDLRTFPLAVASAAMLLILSLAGAVWIVAALLGAVILARGRLRAALPAVATFILAGGLLALPALLTAKQFLSGTDSLQATSAARVGDEIGNLIEPLPLRQIGGVWLSGDFRIDPERLAMTNALIAIVVLAAVAGLWLAIRRRAWGLPLYAVTAAAGCLAIARYGSPWVDAKGYATASPLLLLLALTAAAVAVEAGRRVPGAVLAGVIAAGVLGSNLLAYKEVNLAPYEQLHELETIGERIDGKGPALMTEYQPYGVRHFLRNGEGEGASELRRRLVPLRTGAPLAKSGYADLDEFADDSLAPYRALVVRRSPASSRPGSAFHLTWSGRWYELWQRRNAPAPIEHLPLGAGVDPAAPAGCAHVRRLAEVAGPGGRLATVRRPAVSALAASALRFPAAWPLQDDAYLLPTSGGSATGPIAVPDAGRYTIWLGGSVRAQVEVFVDGKLTGTRRHVLNMTGGYSSFGTVPLSAGTHRIELRYSGPDIHPGSDGAPYPLGPLVLGTTTAALAISYVPAAEARSLCGARLDWIEALPAS
jgi:hypothetical protein